MYKQAFMGFTDQHLTLAGLILFILFFAVVVWWTSLKSNREFYETISDAPLKDGE